jgi:integrase
MRVKTGTCVWLAAHETLREHLAKTGIDGDYLLSKKLAKGPFTSDSLDNMICIACADVGFRGYSCHGLRHLAGAALAGAGATVDEIMSASGPTAQEMARLYGQPAARKIMAKNAMKKWEQATNESG